MWRTKRSFRPGMSLSQGSKRYESKTTKTSSTTADSMFLVKKRNAFHYSWWLPSVLKWSHTLFSKRSWKIGNCTSYLLDPWAKWHIWSEGPFCPFNKSLPHLSHRMPWCLASVPVENTFCSKMLCTNCLSNCVKHCHLKWMGCFCLHFSFLHSMAFVVEEHFSHASLSMVE